MVGQQVVGGVLVSETGFRESSGERWRILAEGSNDSVPRTVACRACPAEAVLEHTTCEGYGTSKQTALCNQ